MRAIVREAHVARSASVVHHELVGLSQSASVRVPEVGVHLVRAEIRDEAAGGAWVQQDLRQD